MEELYDNIVDMCNKVMEEDISNHNTEDTNKDIKADMCNQDMADINNKDME